MDCPDDLSRSELYLISKINSYRIESGLHPLAYSKELTCAAQWQAEQTMETGLQAHTLNGTTPQDRAQACGYTNAVQENVAAFTKHVLDANEKMENSQIHAFVRRRNVHQEIGVAIETDNNRTSPIYAGAYLFPTVIVEVFGRGIPGDCYIE